MARTALLDIPELLSPDAQRLAAIEKYGSVIEPVEPTLTDRIRNFVYDATMRFGGDRGDALRRAGMAEDVIGVTPLQGFSDYQLAKRAYSEGDKTSGDINMAMAATSLLPGNERPVVSKLRDIFSTTDQNAIGMTKKMLVNLADDGAGTAKIIKDGKEVGEISYALTGNNVQIKRADVTEPRQGIGTEAYKQFIDSKLDQGYTVGSDNIVSEAAQGVYRKLGQQGYEIAQNPESRQIYPGSITTLSRENIREQRRAMPTVYRDGARMTAPGQVYEGPSVYNVSRSALNDLDMSYDTRMQRAADQGFSGPYYHGSERIDRVVEGIKPDRATSGPMPFFANDPSVAS
ncbi:MAG: hypothetical protein EBZ18_06135, partial [Alphaproteobacteria bacterium]|nr:hypothetical protein [Alphaproteobacteria bacterium]